MLVDKGQRKTVKRLLNCDEFQRLFVRADRFVDARSDYQPGQSVSRFVLL